MALRLIPFNAIWITSDKIDIHAIYRRPRYVIDEYGDLQRELDATGLPTWDLTGGLPVKQHNIWTGKGFEYVTLSNRNSLVIAARNGTLPAGTTYRDFDQHPSGGPWNYRMYLEGQTEVNRIDADRLRADVAQFGAEAVEAIRRQTDPNFRLPESLKVTVSGFTDQDVAMAQLPPKRRGGRPKGSKNKPNEVPAA